MRGCIEETKKDQIHLILFVKFICEHIDTKIIVATRLVSGQQTLSRTLFGHGGSYNAAWKMFLWGKFFRVHALWLKCLMYTLMYFGYVRMLRLFLTVGRFRVSWNSAATACHSTHCVLFTIALINVTCVHKHLWKELLWMQCLLLSIVANSGYRWLWFWNENNSPSYIWIIQQQC